MSFTRGHHLPQMWVSTSRPCGCLQPPDTPRGAGLHYHAHRCVAFNDIFHVLLCVNKQHVCVCVFTCVLACLLMTLWCVLVCVCVCMWSFAVHTAAPDLQPTSDPILCGGSEPLLTVMASVLRLRKQASERAWGKQPQQERWSEEGWTEGGESETAAAIKKKKVRNSNESLQRETGGDRGRQRTSDVKVN